MRAKMTTTALLALAVGATPAAAEGLTVNGCVTIYNGLNSLNCVGQQIGGQCPPGAPQYKFGAARMTIALDIAALKPVADAATKSAQDIAAEVAAAIPIPDDSKSRADLTEKRNAEINREWNAAIAKPCDAKLDKVRAADLKIGDGPNENAVPPSVLGALAPIIDQGK